ncbi:MAG: ribonuclease HII [Gemmatimonadota bacterium]
MSQDGSPSKGSTEGPRPQDPLHYERRFWGRGLSTVAGVDEAGRGPLAGPVVAAAVILPSECCIDGATDSKRLAPGMREELYERIFDRAAAIGIGAASVREIDTLDILRATALAMDRAVRALRIHPGHIVVDGLPVRDVEWDHEAVVKGDGRIHSVSCASIIAKVCRDRLMCRLARRYPRYRWDSNKGYGTPEHLRALREWGPSPHHRLTFRPSQTSLDL